MCAFYGVQEASYSRVASLLYLGRSLQMVGNIQAFFSGLLDVGTLLGDIDGHETVKTACVGDILPWFCTVQRSTLSATSARAILERTFSLPRTILFHGNLFGSALWGKSEAQFLSGGRKGERPSHFASSDPGKSSIDALYTRKLKVEPAPQCTLMIIS
jgi:hypothetical protein